LGHVQSGKRSNYTGPDLQAAALPVPRFIIVLAGHFTTGLRSQTQIPTRRGIHRVITLGRQLPPFGQRIPVGAGENCDARAKRGTQITARGGDGDFIERLQNQFGISFPGRERLAVRRQKKET